MKHVFIAGTFDPFHAGHVSLLEKAFEVGEQVTIGITSDTYISNYKKNVPNRRPYEERKRILEVWLTAHELQEGTIIIPIEDQYEPAVSGDYDSLIVTSQNRTTGEEINQKREEKGLLPLTLIELPLLTSTDGLVISSTRVRTGEIDEKGNLVMPEHLRPLLAKPLGPIVSSEQIRSARQQYNGVLVTVGDYTTKDFLSQGLKPKLAIIDLHVQREPFLSLDQFKFPQDYIVHMVKSGPGYISSDAVNVIKQSLASDQKVVIVVSGEDDLLVLPVILLSRVGTIVYYGQPNKGCVEVVVSETIKNTVKSLVESFEKR